MRRVARLAAVFVAAFAWSAAALELADWAGILSGAPVASAAAPIPDDPCGLRQFLPVGTDARCDLALSRDGGSPLIIELLQQWESTAPAVLVQQLVVREAAGGTALLDVRTRSAATSLPSRVQRLAVLTVDGVPRHLVYVIGNCGGLGCGQNDVVVAEWAGGRVQDLLRRRVGPLAEIALSDGSLTIFDGTGRGVGRQRSDRMLRTYAWIGGVYTQISFDPVPTIPPP